MRQGGVAQGCTLGYGMHLGFQEASDHGVGSAVLHAYRSWSGPSGCRLGGAPFVQHCWPSFNVMVLRRDA